MAHKESTTTTDILAIELVKFQTQLAVEVSNTYLSFFHYDPRCIRTNFYLLYF